jgi:hypothetical protein
MKKVLLPFVVVLLVVFAVGTSSAQGKMSLSVGPDVLVPMGTFGDAFSIGFGGSVRGQYDFTPELSGGVTTGYYTWTAKDAPAGVDKPTFHGVPLRAYGKYYFMPGKGPRVYGMFELGFFFGTVSVTSIYGSATASETDFNYAPGIGVEIPAGNMKMDLSARYDGISTPGNTSGSLALRVGLNFALGN